MTAINRLAVSLGMIVSFLSLSVCAQSAGLALPRPAYPPLARAARLSGTITVQVLIDEQGNVSDTHAIDGHPLLQTVCVAAAREAKFSPTLLEGEPVKVTGVIKYNFVPQ